MSGFRSAMFRLFYGRNGVDSLVRFTLIVSVILSLVNIFIGSLIIYLIQLVFLVLTFLRMFSKNTLRRQSENAVYLKIRNRIKQFFVRQINRVRYYKTKAYRRCPKCKCHLCLPRKKGKHTVKCPNCSERFEVKI